MFSSWPTLYDKNAWRSVQRILGSLRLVPVLDLEEVEALREVDATREPGDFADADAETSARTVREVSARLGGL